MAGAVQSEESLAAKFEVLLPHLDERQRRLVMAAEARALGHGGIRAVAQAAGVSETTVRKGVAELEPGEEPLGRVRRPGGGRKPADRGWIRGCGRRCWRWSSRTRAGIRVAAALDDASRLRQLAGELAAAGPPVSAPTRSAELLRDEGFSLQANAKTLEGAQHPDRDAQFRYINDQAEAAPGRRRAGDLRGHQEEGAGRRLQERRARVAARRASPSRSGCTTSSTTELGKADPVRRLRPRRQHRLGQRRHRPRHRRVRRRHASAAGGRRRAGTTTPSARRLLITADGGGSNGYRARAVEDRAAALADRDRPGDHRLPPPARHQQVEQDRAPAVLPHHHELARHGP